MKMIKNTLAAMAVLVMVGFGADAVYAQEASVKYGVVDMNRVMQATDAAKGILSDLEGKRKEYQTQIKKEEDTLNAAEKEIIKQKETLSAAEFDVKRGEFQKKLQNAQKMVQDKKRTLDEAFSASMGKLRTEAAKVIAEVAKERGYAAVFTADAVIMADDDLDMTKDVVERLNKNVKKIPVEWAAKKK